MRPSPVSWSAQLEYRLGTSGQINRPLNTVQEAGLWRQGAKRPELSQLHGLETQGRFHELEGLWAAGGTSSVLVRTGRGPRFTA